MKRNLLGTGILAILTVGILVGCWNESPSTLENTAVLPSPTATVRVIEESATESVSANLPESSEETIAAAPDEAVEINQVRILMADEVATLEPYRMVAIHPDMTVAAHLWDALTRIDNDLQVRPHLATSWRLVNNFTWEIELRQNVAFHNAEPFNAEAVRFSIERSQSLPDSLETFAQDVGLKGVEVVDDYTLRLTTSQPVANLPYHLAFLEILPPRYYSETDADRLAAAPVGSGPYRVDRWLPDEPLVLEAEPSYWLGAPAISRLIFEAVPLPEERLAALRLGEATLVTDLPPMQPDQLNAPNRRLEAIESTQRMFIGMNVKADTPLANKLVRQALNYGVNVEEITATWLEGYGERYGSWVNSTDSNPELAPWPYDPQLARELLTQAGYREGFSTTLLVPADLYYESIGIAETVAQQLEEIGVSVEVESAERPNYIRSLLSANPSPLFLLGLTSRGNGLEDTRNLSVNFPFNPTGWSSSSFENLVRRAASTFNPEARARFLIEAQAEAYDEAPWIWLWKQYYFYGVAEELDWMPRPDGLVFLYRPATGSFQATE